MNDIANEIFNILKGANYKLRLFTKDGTSTLDDANATRFYAYDQDLMVSLRQKDDNIEIVVQAGTDYDIPGNSELLKSIKTVAHNNLGEFTVRKFNKSITPKDFAHQSVTEGKAFGKAYGSIKTSYIPAPNGTKVIVKHSNKVNEEKRGSRSRNIHNIFIENSQGERFNFQYQNVSGAKAMAKHVSEGGTPYDSKGQAIMAMCEDLSNITQFMKHVKGNNLVNENNEDVVLTVREAATTIKNMIKSLSTQKGYNNFVAPGEKESVKEVDLSEKFMYNAIETEELSKAVSTVSRIVAEKSERDSMEKELIGRLAELVKTGDFGVTIDANDPEHPSNEDPIKYSGSEGAVARLSTMLSLYAARSKNMDASNLFAELAGRIHDMSTKNIVLVGKVVDFIEKKSVSNESAAARSVVGLAESAMLGLRRKIA